MGKCRLCGDNPADKETDFICVLCAINARDKQILKEKGLLEDGIFRN